MYHGTEYTAKGAPNTNTGTSHVHIHLAGLASPEQELLGGNTEGDRAANESEWGNSHKQVLLSPFWNAPPSPSSLLLLCKHTRARWKPYASLSTQHYVDGAGVSECVFNA